jgi:hypothetical protein
MLNNTKIISGNAYLLDEKNKENIKFFSREELNQILSLYARGVSSGEWKDYAIDSKDSITSFSIFRRSSEMPFLKIVKDQKTKRTDEKWQAVSMSGEILKRNKNLTNLIKFLNRKNLSLVK